MPKLKFHHLFPRLLGLGKSQKSFFFVIVDIYVNFLDGATTWAVQNKTRLIFR